MYLYIYIYVFTYISVYTNVNYKDTRYLYLAIQSELESSVYQRVHVCSCVTCVKDRGLAYFGIFGRYYLSLKLYTGYLYTRAHAIRSVILT